MLTSLLLRLSIFVWLTCNMYRHSAHQADTELSRSVVIKEVHSGGFQLDTTKRNSAVINQSGLRRQFKKKGTSCGLMVGERKDVIENL
jgi:hypothetical protein